MPGAAEQPALPLFDALGFPEDRRVHTGVGASGGAILGPAHVALPFEVDLARLQDMELGHLVAAIRQSAEELETMIGRADNLGAELFEFQARMLRDPELANLARGRVTHGEPVALAWAAAMDDYIADFEDAGNAEWPRNMDLIDIRNRVLASMSATPRPDFPAGSVFIGDDIEPSIFLDHDWSEGGGIALRRGSAASHVAMLSRARGIPMVTGLGAFDVEDGTPVLVDGQGGRLIVRPSPDEIDQTTAGRTVAQAGSLIGVPSGIQLYAAVNRIEDLDRIDPATCAGIGLVRTEFLLGSPATFVQEEAQFALYRQLAARSPGPVAIRLLDLGGDKPVRGLTFDEPNPFLGRRGIRFLLERRDLLVVQARALLRAAATGDLRVLVPMVTVPAEMQAVTDVFAQEAEKLRGGNVACANPLIGMMVETPAAALALDAFRADFFAIGASDLLQYLAAASRNDGGLADLRRDAVPALMRLIDICVARARALGKPIGVCGDIAADPTFVAPLFDAGVRSFTAPPDQLWAIANALASSERHD